MPKDSEQSADWSYGQDPHLAVSDDVAHPVTGPNAKRLSNGLGKRSLSLRRNARFDHY